MSEAPLSLIQEYLIKRQEHLVPIAPPDATPRMQFVYEQRQLDPTEDNARQLLELTAHFSPKTVETILTHPYIYENLPRFLEKKANGEYVTQPQSIQLAFEVSEKVNTYANIYDYEAQNIPALTTCAYAVVEYLRDHKISRFDRSSIQTQLKQLAGQEEKENLRIAKKNSAKERGESKPRGKSSIVKHLTNYAKEYDPQQHGRFEDFVVLRLTKDIHARIIHTQEETLLLDQSEGIEIENLTYVTESQRAIERDVSHWLPRGIPSELQKRADWQITALLGVPEDIGERKYQRYEWSPNPTETTAAQTTIIAGLEAAGFIEEDQLSNIYEGYSLHVSTLFPSKILTEASMAEYQNMARALAGAFSSDQRIGFGGFMSGGKEILDKTLSGAAREIKKIKDIGEGPFKTPRGYNLVEIRNLDITPHSHYSAIHAKQYLDFMFKSYYKSQTDIPLSHLEKRTASYWKEFSTELQQVFDRYNIGNDPEKAWKQLAEANEKDGQLRGELASLIRTHTGKVRSELDHNRDEYIFREHLASPHVVLQEVQGQTEQKIYLSKTYRDGLRVKPGDTISIQYEGKTVQLTVAQAKIRGNNEIDASLTWYVSPDACEALEIPQGRPVKAQYEAKTNTIRFNNAEENEQLIKQVLYSPRLLTPEPLGNNDNRIYMTAKDREKFGLQPGDEISLRFGQITRKVFVAQSKIRPDEEQTPPESKKWRLSKNLFKDLGIPDHPFELRANFDRNTKELAFGPVIGILLEDRSLGENLFKGKKTMVQALQRHAATMGGVGVIINPNSSENETLANGMVYGYVSDGHDGLEKVKIAFPNVIYDRDVHWLASPEERFERRLEKAGITPKVQYVFPPEMQDLTVNKEAFSKIIENNPLLKAFLPESRSMTDANALDKFLEEQQDVFLKPTSSQRGIGLIHVWKNNGFYEFAYSDDSNGGPHTVHESAASINEFLSLTAKYRRNRPYIMQQYLHIAQIEIPHYKYPDQLVSRNVELRALIQRGIDRKPRVTGIVARLPDSDLSGHEYILDGLKSVQKAFGIDSEVSKQIFSQSKALSVAVARAVEEYVQKPCGEITVDIAVTESGELYILEANSKAMTRGMFEEAGNTDAEIACMAKPMMYATSISEFN